MTTNFPKKARRDDPNGHMVVQDNLDFLRDQFDKTTSGLFRAGQATISAASTSTSVVHGLGTAAYRIAIVPLADAGSLWWVSAKSSTGFTINVQVAPGANITFDWLVKGD